MISSALSALYTWLVRLFIRPIPSKARSPIAEPWIKTEDSQHKLHDSATALSTDGLKATNTEAKKRTPVVIDPALRARTLEELGQLQQIPA